MAYSKDGLPGQLDTIECLNIFFSLSPGRRAGMSAMSDCVERERDSPADVVLPSVLRALFATVPDYRDLRGQSACQLPSLPRERTPLR